MIVLCKQIQFYSDKINLIKMDTNSNSKYFFKLSFNIVWNSIQDLSKKKHL